MKVKRKVLEPLARVEVEQRASAGLALDDNDFMERVAKELFYRHYGNPTSTVKERMWDGIPNSEKGKYRKIVRTEIQRFHRRRKRNGS